MAIYGAFIAKSPTKEVNYAYNAIGKNSEVFHAGDVVTMDTTNGLYVSTDETPVLGVIVATATMASNNQTVGKVCPAYIPIDQDYEFLMGTNSALNALTDIGKHYELTGTTGAILVDVTEGEVVPGSGGAVTIMAVNPFGGGTSTCLVKFSKIYNSRTA